MTKTVAKKKSKVVFSARREGNRTIVQMDESLTLLQQKKESRDGNEIRKSE